MKKVFVEHLAEGRRAEDVFLVSDKAINTTKAGKSYLKMKLLDKTGSIDAVKWETSQSELEKINENDYVSVSGITKTFNGNLQFNIETIYKCGEEVNPADFIASTKYDVDEMMNEMLSILKTIQNPQITKLLDQMLGDPIISKQFKECPGAVSIHHAYVGGLLEHTLNVVRTCVHLANLYPELDRDILLASAALHDVGKIKEYEWKGAIKISAWGNLIGHLVGGATMIKDVADTIEGFDPVLSMALQHAILSHHGVHEFGSPKLPCSIEAIALHMADDLDAKMAIFTKAIEESNKTGDPGLFTKKIKFLERSIFKGAEREKEIAEMISVDEDGIPAETLFADDIFDGN